MNQERGQPFVPIEKVAIPRHESTDKATRKMIAQMTRTLLPRFPLQPTGDAIEYKSMRFLKMRNPCVANAEMLGAVRVTEPEFALQPGVPVEIISGMCKFGATGLTGKLPDGTRPSLVDPYEPSFGGQALTEIKETWFLHPSELENLVRLTNTFDTLTAGGAAENGGAILRFHIPEPEYKLYMLGRVKRGEMSRKQFVETVAKIERRAQKLGEMVKKRVNFSVTVHSPLSPLNDLIARKDAMTTFQDCIDTLSRDAFWHLALQVVRPPGFQELNNMSYCMGYLLTARNAALRGAQPLAIDTSEEQPIFDHAIEMANRMGKSFKMATLYVPPIALTKTGLHGKEDIFMHESNGMPLVQELMELMRIIQMLKRGRGRTL
ncbi:MAG TPA: hypothetical protein VFG51_01885 [Candidatus Saccharimonadia bacterium]|nr:hypothetical protein [Candidatus Saccharimonadia bacterium]